MFEALAADVRNLSVPVDSAALVELFAIRDALDARITTAVAEFDAAGLWDLDAATSMVAWLRDRAGLTRRDAAHTATLARRLADLPVASRAWHDGEVSGAQVQAITANTASHRDLFAKHEERVVPTLVGLSLEQTITVMQHWKEHAEALDDKPGPMAEPPSRLHHSRVLDGRGVLDGEFDAEDDAIIGTALRTAETRDGEGEPARSPAERRADALVDVCRFFLDNQTARSGGRHRPHLNVILDVERWTGHIVNGPELSREVLERYCCDSAMHRLVAKGPSNFLDLGMSTRVLTAGLWTALVARDERCRFPGCDRPATWCDGHHVVWFSRNGPTRLDNLVLTCRRHHKRLHRPGWRAKLLADATFEVTDPDGVVRTTRPPGALDPLGFVA